MVYVSVGSCVNKPLFISTDNEGDRKLITHGSDMHQYNDR